MTRTLLRGAFAALVVSLSLTTVARADQLEAIPREAAERVHRELKPGMLIVDWISHMDGKPTLYMVKSAPEVKEWQYGQEEKKVSVEVYRVGTASPVSDPWADYPFEFEVHDAEPERLTLDLAYIYVVSSEVPNTYVNLGKKLALPCHVGSIAIEIPAEVAEAAWQAFREARRQESSGQQEQLSASERQQLRRGISDAIPGEE